MTFTPQMLKTANTNTGGYTPTPKFDPNATTMPQTLQPSTPNNSVSPGYASNVASNIGNTFQQGGRNVTQDIANTGKNAQEAGGSPLDYGLAGLQTAGHVAGDIANTAGGTLSSFITPLLPDSVKSGIGDVTKTITDKVNSIPGMTPEIAKSLGDVFNTLTLKGGAEAEPSVTSAVKSGAKTVGDTAQEFADQITTPKTVSPNNLDAATQARESAAQGAVSSLDEMRNTASDFKNDLGTSFQKGATDIEKANPNLKYTLSHDQIDALNTLKNNKSFALPSYLKTTSKEFGSSDVGDIQKGGISLTPSQTQDLIHQLNNSTFTEKSSGLAVDQSKIGLTNEIKQGAKQAFDKPTNGAWSKIYNDYSTGRGALDKLSDIVNLDKNATPSDINKNLNSILKLGKTPEGKIILQNSLNEFKKVSGYDFTDPVKTVHQIVDKQVALEDAQKGGFMKQMVKGATNPSAVGRRLILGGASVAVLYPVIRAIEKAASGK